MDNNKKKDNKIDPPTDITNDEEYAKYYLHSIINGCNVLDTDDIGAEYFAVHPRYDCVHSGFNIDISSSSNNTEKCEINNDFWDNNYNKNVDIAKEFFLKPCESCSIETNECWVCTKCWKTYCSRYINGCMQKHSKNETCDLNHIIALSLADLSAWCYKCDSYVESDLLHKIRSYLYEAKFNEKYPKFIN